MPNLTSIINASKVQTIGLQGFASSAVFTWPRANWLPLFQASWQLSIGKMLPQPAEGSKCFPRVHLILKHRFLHYRNKQTYFSLAKMCWLECCLFWLIKMCWSRFLFINMIWVHWVLCYTFFYFINSGKFLVCVSSSNICDLIAFYVFSQLLFLVLFSWPLKILCIFYFSLSDAFWIVCIN